MVLSTHLERPTIPVPRGTGTVDTRSKRARRGEPVDPEESDEIPGKD